MAGRYLCLRIEVPFDTHHFKQVSFFQKDNGDELWVHFKYERLADFCYNCGMLTHVTGRCEYKELVKITSKSGVYAKLYGTWLKATNKEFLHFLDTLVSITKENQT